MATEIELTPEEKLLKSVLYLKQTFPFLSSAYLSLDREESDTIKTMGVTEDKVLYNKDFIAKLNQKQVNFVNIHELMHIIYKHPTYSIGKDLQLYNIAADLYINKLVKSLDSAQYLEMPDGVYCSSVDTTCESVDMIYADFEKQGHRNGYFKAKNKLGNVKKTAFDFFYVGKRGYSKNDDKSTFRFTLNLDGSGLAVALCGDEEINSDLSNKDGISADKTLSEQLANGTIRKMQVRAELDNNIGKQAGSGNSMIESLVNNMIKPKFDWRKYVQKFCIASNQKETSFKNPDKRMYYQRAIYPGHATSEYNMLENIKIFIDTSGSISSEELQYVLGILHNLFSKYKSKAEIYSFNTKVSKIREYDCTKDRDLKVLNIKDTGGTDAKCIFDWLVNNERKNKTSLVIIITDGYFCHNYDNDKVRRYYKNKTLWIMSKDYDKAFKPLFGEVGIPDYK